MDASRQLDPGPLELGPSGPWILPWKAIDFRDGCQGEPAARCQGEQPREGAEHLKDID